MIRISIARLLFVLVAGLAGNAAYAADVSGNEKAAQVLQRARPLAEQGNANAQYNMGVIYDRGYGVERDYAKAREWYKKAAAQNYAKAEHNLGVMYQEGHGVQPNSTMAARWFERAARHGEPAAQNNLAVMYARGEGVEQNTILAAVWAARAAQAGNASAIANLPRIAAGLPTANIDGSHVNIRSEPTTDSVVLKQAAEGVEVIVLESLGDWTRILFPTDYTLGWVADFLLTESVMVASNSEAGDTPKVQPAAAAPAAAEPEAPPEPKSEPTPEPAVASVPEPAPAMAPESGPAAAEKPPQAKTQSPSDTEASVERAAIGSAVVNIRKRPTTNSPVLFQVQQGDRVTILKGQNGWKYVEFEDGRAGWVAGFLLVDV